MFIDYCWYLRTYFCVALVFCYYLLLWFNHCWLCKKCRHLIFVTINQEFTMHCTAVEWVFTQGV